MDILEPVSIGLVMGLLFAWPVLGLALAFRLFAFPDLTVEGSFAMGAAVFAVATVSGASAPVAITLAATAGTLLGFATAAIHNWLHLNKFLAGIIVVAISYTLCLRVMKAPNIGLLQGGSWLDIAQSVDALSIGLQGGTAVLLASLLLVVTLLLRLAMATRWGLRLRTAGSNPDYARALGLHVGLFLMAGLGLTNALSAVGGAVLSSYQGFADVGMGQGCLVLALASMTIGERLVPERHLAIASHVLLSAVAGSILYQIIVAGALRLGIAPSDLKLITALLVLAIVALRLRQRDRAFVESFQ